MTKEERDAMKDRVKEYDRLAERVSSAKGVLDCFDKYPLIAMEHVERFFRDMKMQEQEREIAALIDAMRPVIASILESDTQKLAALGSSIGNRQPDEAIAA